MGFDFGRNFRAKRIHDQPGAERGGFDTLRTFYIYDNATLGEEKPWAKKGKNG